MEDSIHEELGTHFSVKSSCMPSLRISNYYEIDKLSPQLCQFFGVVLCINRKNILALFYESIEIRTKHVFHEFKSL